MYLRFTVPTEHGGTVTRARHASRPFRLASDFYGNGEYDTDPVLIALRRELDWFKDELPVPMRFGKKISNAAATVRPATTAPSGGSIGGEGWAHGRAERFGQRAGLFL